jgi:CheY-like chemotaxis protein
MSATKPRILVVDDEPINRLLINNYLRGGEYQLNTACDGQEAWEQLSAEPKGFDLVLLDIMMPRVDGWEVLRRIKTDPVMQAIPVVVQTALNCPQDVHRGIRSGAYHYLSKPYEKEMLRSVIAAGVRDSRRYRRLQDQVERVGRMLGLVRRAEFQFRTPEEGRELARTLASACPDPGRVVVGLAELLVNAVEHGNLAIDHRDRNRLLETNSMDQEVFRRLRLPEYRDRFVQVNYERDADEIRIHIRNQGEGWPGAGQGAADPRSGFDTQGRGILAAHRISFDELEFREPGNEVVAVIRIPATH